MRSAACRPSRTTWYIGRISRIWSSAGRQPAWLTPRSLYSAAVACWALSRSPLKRRWISLISGAIACIRRIETIWRRMSGTRAVSDDQRREDDRDADVADEACGSRRSRIRNSWKIGLNSQARRLTGSALSAAGLTISGVGASVADGAIVGAASRRPRRWRRERCSRRRRARRDRGARGDDQQHEQDQAEGEREARERATANGQARAGGSSNRVEAAGMARVAARDAAGAHPGAPDQAVALDRLLRVDASRWARSGSWRAATRTANR